MPTLGEQIRALRKKAGMTQEQLADKLGTTKAAISRYEKNQRQPRLEQITEIANALDANIDELLSLFIGTENTFFPDYSGDGYEKHISLFNAMIDAVTACQDRNSGDLEKDIQKMLSIFSRLNPYYRNELLEEAEETLRFQEERKARIRTRNENPSNSFTEGE